MKLIKLALTALILTAFVACDDTPDLHKEFEEVITKNLEMGKSYKVTDIELKKIAPNQYKGHYTIELLPNKNAVYKKIVNDLYVDGTIASYKTKVYMDESKTVLNK